MPNSQRSHPHDGTASAEPATPQSRNGRPDNESTTFGGFSIRTDDRGTSRAVFTLASPEWETEWASDGMPAIRPVCEIALDETNLIQRIRNLRSNGQDASVSAAALQALRRAIAAEPPAAMAEPLPPAIFATLLEACGDAVAVATSREDSAEPCIAYVNQAFVRLTGHGPDTAIGRGLDLLQGLGADDIQEAALRDLLVAARCGQVARRSLRLRDGAGVAVQADAILMPLVVSSLGGVAHLAVVLRPAMADTRQRQPLALPGDRDPGTGMPGRASVLATLAGALAARQAPERGPCIARLSVDWPQPAQDAGVREAAMLGIADRLIENLRRIDAPARVDAAEFAVCLPRLGLADATAIMQRLCRAVAAAPVETPVGPLKVALRVGLAEASRPVASMAAGTAGTAAELAAALFADAGRLLANAPKAARRRAIPAAA